MRNGCVMLTMATSTALVPLCLAAAVAGGCARSRSGEESGVGTSHMVLLGASVGKDWKLESLPGRSGRREYSIESIAVYDFDKTVAVGDILLRPKRRFQLTRTYLKGFFRPAPRVPDIVVIKECAAYFPGDEARYRALYSEWVRRLRARGMSVVVATTVPVTTERDAARRGQQEGIRSFNHWVRTFAAEQGLPVADLAAALADGSREGYLRREFTSGDGLHLNREAYALLDPVLLAALDNAAAAGK